MHMLQLQGTATVLLSPLAKAGSFRSITVIPKLELKAETRDLGSKGHEITDLLRICGMVNRNLDSIML